MARIRTVKPAFFRHERLQELETKHASLRPMLVFQGLWTQADREGRFLWNPRLLKLDILPFVDFNLAQTLELLKANGFIEQYEIGGRQYGYIPTWHEHQKPHHQEPQSKIPPRPEAKPTNAKESPTPVRESPSGFDRERRMGKENGKGNGVPAPNSADAFDPTPENLPALQLARGLIDTLNIPFSTSLLTQIANCIEAKSRESGITFAEAHDYIRGRAVKATPKPAKWLFWFRDAQYDAPAAGARSGANPYGEIERRAPGDLPLSKRLELEERRAAHAQ